MWLSKYLSALAASPIATCVLTLTIIALTIHTVVPAVLGMANFMIGYWDRFENVRINKYIDFWTTGADSEERTVNGNTYRLIQVKDANQYDMSSGVRNKEEYKNHWLWMCGGRTLHKCGRDWDSYARPSDLYKTKEQALAMRTPSQNSWQLILGAIIVGGIALTLVGIALDWLLFSYFLQTLVVIAIIGGVAAVMFGGRFAFDMSKKIDKIDAASQKADAKEE